MRVVLDVNVVRCSGYGEVDVTGLQAARHAGWSLHLADGAAAELTAQLMEGRFTWDRWLIARDKLVGLLDPTEPVLLGGRAGLFREGFRGPLANVTDREILESLRSSAAIWRQLVEASDVQGLSLPLEDGRAGLSLERTTGVILGMKNEWIANFAADRFDAELVDQTRALLAPRGDSPDRLEEVVASTAKALDERASADSVSPSVRMDAMIRVYVLLQLRSLREKEPYPAAKKANDVFDHDLLRYLAYPAVVCTVDERFRRYLVSAKCWQTPWVVAPDELASQSVREEIEQLTWPKTSAT